MIQISASYHRDQICWKYNKSTGKGVDCGWMIGVLWPFNIIGNIESGCQRRETSNMDETPLRTQTQNQSDLNLEQLVHKPRVLTTGMHRLPTGKGVTSVITPHARVYTNMVQTLISLIYV